MPAESHATSLTVAQRALRKLHDLHERHLADAPVRAPSTPTPDGQAVADRLHDLLATGAPAMVARFGAGELEAVCRHVAMHTAGPLRRARRYVMGRTPPPWWDPEFLDAMALHTGVFPATPAVLERFAERMLTDMRELDLLGSWLPYEDMLVPLGLSAPRVPMPQLEPYYHARPWSRVLRGKVVMVVHPLASLIEQQYARRERLFPGTDNILPPFTLRTLAAVVSNAGQRPPYPDWFTALDAMTDQLAAATFDVAIIGAGAYGFPLAAAVKRMGRQAVHLGGATQILFGIRGRRWDALPYFQGLVNDAWVRPPGTDRPPRWRDIEGGCYW